MHAVLQTDEDVLSRVVSKNKVGCVKEYRLGQRKWVARDKSLLEYGILLGLELQRKEKPKSFILHRNFSVDCAMLILTPWKEFTAKYVPFFLFGAETGFFTVKVLGRWVTFRCIVLGILNKLHCIFGVLGGILGCYGSFLGFYVYFGYYGVFFQSFRESS